MLFFWTGIIFSHYDAAFKARHQLSLSILKRLGFGQRSAMETRILMEVEEMIDSVRAQRGRPFDIKELTTSCVANVIMNMSYGRRFDLADPAFQQLIDDFNYQAANFSALLEIFPAVRFLPYFKKSLAEGLRRDKRVISFINNNIAACIEVCSYYHMDCSRVDVLPAGCRGNLPVLNLLSTSVAKNQHFRPCRKEYALERKMIHTFKIATTSSITMQSWGRSNYARRL